MIKISELLGKPVVALVSATLVGTAVDIVFDSKLLKAMWLKIHNELDENEPETVYLKLADINNLKSDALTIDHKGLITSSWQLTSRFAHNPINCLTVNQDGKILGYVRDIVLKDLEVEFLIIDGKEYNPKTIFSNSSRLLVFNDTDKPLALNVPKKTTVPKIAKTENLKVKIHTVNNKTKNAPKKVSKADEINSQQKSLPNLPIDPDTKAIESVDVAYPIRVPQEQTLVSRSPASKDNVSIVYGFLLGKTLARALYGDGNDLIAREHSIITEETILKAKNQSKLVQLALYAD